MPINKNTLLRYKVLDELLCDKYHEYTLDDLTEKVNDRLSEIDPDTDGVGRRTIEKDIQFMESSDGPFNVEIERYYIRVYNGEKQKHVTKKCLRYEDKSFSIFKRELSNDEKYLLREALSMLGRFDGLPNLEGLEDLRVGLQVEKDDKPFVSFTTTLYVPAARFSIVTGPAVGSTAPPQSPFSL